MNKISKELGGNRIGSGNKMKIDMRTYNRSTHDLSHAFRSTTTCGVLYPCLKRLVLPGDTFNYDIESITKTIPTIAPLYGSFKKQIDVFACPIRLYNGLLHNNATKIGLNMSAVKMPKMVVEQTVYNPLLYAYDKSTSQVSPSSLMHYLGVSGYGDYQFVSPTNPSGDITRKINATPILAYWDIYKNYYANKQEEKGAYICAIPNTINNPLYQLTFWESIAGGGRSKYEDFNVESTAPVTILGNKYQPFTTPFRIGSADSDFRLSFFGKIEINNTLQLVTRDNGGVITAYDLFTVFPNAYVQTNGVIRLGTPVLATFETWIGIGFNNAQDYDSNINIKTFDLQNIDDARWEILRNTGLNNELHINSLAEPYSDLVARDPNGENLSKYKLHGLALKTYQSDMFNNWLKTEWIDGPTGINTITAVDVSSGSFTIDALNLANKVYNMLNRIAVSGGSYEDYIESVYTIETARRAESPIYIGGMSQEIVFEEITSFSASESQPLGTLAGKGAVRATKGGRITYKASEPCYIIAILSYTPRVDYSQGNDFDMFEIDSLYDLHKPELDGIGFEDLLEERMAWFGTYWDSLTRTWKKKAVGKQPAWINYMSDVNKTHGNFAESNNQMFMTLNRQYEYDELNKGIKDLTTYVDPRKYNYAFADASLSAQNFWEQIGFKEISRRVMSAKIMPTL